MSANIHEAITAVMLQVGYVQKQRSGGLNYSFAGEAELIAALRPPMVEQHIYMSVVGLRDVVRGAYQTAKGATMNTVDLAAVVRFTHGPSATSIDVVALGSGADSGDKASNKAMTGAYKYALRQTFCIQTGDDPDSAPSMPRAEVRQVNQATGEISAPPAAGNGAPKPNGKKTPGREMLLARISQLADEAAGLGLLGPAFNAPPENATEDELLSFGKKLGGEVAKAKKEAAGAHA